VGSKRKRTNRTGNTPRKEMIKFEYASFELTPGGKLETEKKK